MAREDLHFRLRIPPELKDRVEKAAAQNQRSMTAEIIDRLQLTFDADDVTPPDGDLTAAAIRTTNEVIKEMKHQTEVLKWMQEQQSATFGLLEHIAQSDGHLNPAVMAALRAVIASKGDPSANFPRHPDDDGGATDVGS